VATYEKELLAILRANGCVFVREGSRHPIWESPVNGRRFPVPNTIKSRHTANEILKQAGLRKAF
jgi:predicted RNA binding protein YcfA (HicA-like mRNA interferase family)